MSIDRMTPMPGDPPGSADVAPAVTAALAALLRAHAGHTDTALAVKSIDSGQYVFANDAMAARFGIAGAAALLGRTDADLLGAARAAALRAADETARAAWPQAATSEHRLEVEAGRLRQQVTRVAVADASGEAPRWLALLWTDFGADEDRDAALQRALQQLEAEQVAQRQLREQLAALSSAGGGLAGRGGTFDEHLRREADLSVREQREFSLVLIEVDPPAADAPAEAATRARDALDRLLGANIRAMDATARLGDDRFGVLLSGAGLAIAHTRLEGVRRQCATQLLAIDGREQRFTVSVGIASFPHTAATRSELMEAALDALGRAREAGGNQVRLASIRFEPPV
jgi:diguanylate cyclase (GGDEF)-like protein